jgi:hypothetical protein
VGADLGHRVGEVGGVGAVDVRLERGQVDLDDLVEEPLRVGCHLVVGPQVLGHRVGAVGDALPVRDPQVAGHRLVVGEEDVVAPISAPMLQIVALPVALMEAAPSPKYSTMDPVPPETVRTSATFRITSFGTTSR